MAGKRKYSWASIVGKFIPSDTAIEFQGGTIDRDELDNQQGIPTSVKAPLVGYAVCDEWFQEGRISVDIEFDEIDPAQPPVAEIVLQYNPQAEELFNAGLGGVPGTFASVRTWSISFPGKGAEISAESQRRYWFNIDAKGDVGNLEPRRAYHVVVELRGSVLVLQVDGIEIIRRVIGQFVQPLQAGVFAMSKSRIRFKNFTVTATRPRAFVAMQFNTPAYEDLFTDVIVPVCDSVGVEAYRASDTFEPGLVIADIAAQLRESWMVIAEITPINPNVFYEIGYADALGKPVILIANKQTTTLPFDVRAYRVLFYEDTIGGKDRVTKDLKKYLQTILQSPRTFPTQ